MYPFESLPPQDQERFIENLEQLRATVERIRFYALVEASAEEKQKALEEFNHRRNLLIALIHQFDDNRDERAD